MEFWGTAWPKAKSELIAFMAAHGGHESLVVANPLKFWQGRNTTELLRWCEVNYELVANKLPPLIFRPSSVFVAPGESFLDLIVRGFARREQGKDVPFTRGEIRRLVKNGGITLHLAGHVDQRLSESKLLEVVGATLGTFYIRMGPETWIRVEWWED
jgi:hypothetical protein